MKIPFNGFSVMLSWTVWSEACRGYEVKCEIDKRNSDSCSHILCSVENLSMFRGIKQINGDTIVM